MNSTNCRRPSGSFGPILQGAYNWPKPDPNNPTIIRSPWNGEYPAWPGKKSHIHKATPIGMPLSRRFSDRHGGTNCLFIDGRVENWRTQVLDAMAEQAPDCIWDVS